MAPATRSMASAVAVGTASLNGALYTAVAQVLAYVYRLRAAMQGTGPMPGEPPQPVVPAGLDPHERKTQPTPSAA